MSHFPCLGGDNGINSASDGGVAVQIVPFSASADKDILRQLRPSGKANGLSVAIICGLSIPNHISDGVYCRGNIPNMVVKILVGVGDIPLHIVQKWQLCHYSYSTSFMILSKVLKAI